MRQARLKSIFKYLLIVVVIGLSLVIGLNHKLEIWQLFTINSGSMVPYLKPGSLILVKQEASYQAGEVITFLSSANQQFVTHRITDVFQRENQTLVLTKGDANPDSDLIPTTNDSIVGKVYWIIPYLGYLITWAQQPVGVIILVVIPTTILIYEELRCLVIYLLKPKLK